MKGILQLKALKELDVSFTNVTSVGLCGLRELNALQRVDVSGVPLSSDEFVELSKVLSQVEIKR